MLTLSWWFFAIAVIAGILGFTGIMAAVAPVAKVVFWIFVVLFAISLFAKMFRGGPESTSTSGPEKFRGPQ